MYVKGKTCELCGHGRTCVDVNTVHITESGNELPKRVIVCPDCLLYTLMELEDAETVTPKKPTLTLVK